VLAWRAVRPLARNLKMGNEPERSERGVVEQLGAAQVVDPGERPYALPRAVEGDVVADSPLLRDESSVGELEVHPAAPSSARG